MKNKQKRAATIFSHSFLSFSKMEMKRGKDGDDDDMMMKKEGLLRERKDQLRDARDELSAMATKDFPSWLS